MQTLQKFYFIFLFISFSFVHLPVSHQDHSSEETGKTMSQQSKIKYKV